MTTDAMAKDALPRVDLAPATIGIVHVTHESTIRPMPVRRIETTAGGSVTMVLRRILHLVVELLKELSDENAYQRHLTAHGVVHSAEEWRTFQNARLRAKYLRAKCC